MPQKFRSVNFSNYKSFKSYRLHLRDFNALVGPNNAGKSTVLNAFRILSEGLRRARARAPTLIHTTESETLGWHIHTRTIPVATENIFTDYDDSAPARIRFDLSDSSSLTLIFPEPDLCYLTCDSPKGRILRPRDFRKAYTIDLGFSPILGPVEADEQLFNKEAARHALTTAQQARNFRNIWYHYPNKFDRFRELVQYTWPDMDITPPELQRVDGKPLLRMFCKEHRVDREIHWAGFGFQVWCQMLTYMVHAEVDSLLIIDEPDIYLHADLQRQLVYLLHEISPDILIATHSTEILTECDATDIILVDKAQKRARRLKQPRELTRIFGSLGSSLNPVITQLAKAQRALFIEGKDFSILSRLATRAGFTRLGSAVDFAPIPVGGFNVHRMEDFTGGVEASLGLRTRNAVVFDRDYRHPGAEREIRDNLSGNVDIFHMHERKEIENYLLIPSALDRAVSSALHSRAQRQARSVSTPSSVADTLWHITDNLKIMVQSQILTNYSDYYRRQDSRLDPSTAQARSLKEFDELWASLEGRLQIAPGKEVFSELNRNLQQNYGINLTPRRVTDAITRDEIPNDLIMLFKQLEEFRVLPPE